MNQSDWEANMATCAKRGKIKWNHDWFWFWSVELHEPEKTGKRVGFSPHESSLKPLLDLIPVWNTALNVKTRDTSFYYFITTTTTTSGTNFHICDWSFEESCREKIIEPWKYFAIIVQRFSFDFFSFFRRRVCCGWSFNLAFLIT